MKTTWAIIKAIMCVWATGYFWAFYPIATNNWMFFPAAITNFILMMFVICADDYDFYSNICYRVERWYYWRKQRLNQEVNK